MKGINQMVKSYKHSRYMKKVTRLSQLHREAQDRFYSELQCGSTELDSYIIAFQ